MKELVFIHKVNVAGKSGRSAKLVLDEYEKKNSITLTNAKVKNIIIAVKDTDSSVECIFSN